MRNWGHSTLRVGVLPLKMSECGVACQSAWRSLWGALPSGQIAAIDRVRKPRHRTPRCLTRGPFGGFAPLGVLCRRVAGVSRL